MAIYNGRTIFSISFYKSICLMQTIIGRSNFNIYLYNFIVDMANYIFCKILKIYKRICKIKLRYLIAKYRLKNKIDDIK